jgi:hypothetical protein
MPYQKSIGVRSLLALVFVGLLKAATVIVSGHVGTVTSNAEQIDLTGVGSGVVIGRIDASHYAIVTAAHVARYERPRITVYGHADEAAPVEMIVKDPHHEDIAVLIVRSSLPLPVMHLARSMPAAGERFRVVGHPFAHAWRTTYASYVPQMQAANRNLWPLVTAHSTLWTCRGCDRGNSGSGIFDDRGHLAAIVYAAAPFPQYAREDARELLLDRYNPAIRRQVLAVGYQEVGLLLRLAKERYLRAAVSQTNQVRVQHVPAVLGKPHERFVEPVARLQPVKP